MISSILKMAGLLSAIKTVKLNKLKKNVAAIDFIWLLLQHILPKGLRRAREYGFLHSNSKTLNKIIQWIFRLNPFTYSPKIKKRKRMICRCCGSFINIITLRIDASVKLQRLNQHKKKLFLYCSLKKHKFNFQSFFKVSG